MIGQKHIKKDAGLFWECPTKEWRLEDRLRLWQQSQPMEQIDVFVSHTWLAPSRSKFWYLLSRRGWFMSFLLWLMAALVCVILGAFQMLPMSRSVFLFEGQLQESPSAGLWILGFSLLAQVVGLCLSPHVSAPSTTTCFIDLMSINQADKDSVKRGIRSIGYLAPLRNRFAPFIMFGCQSIPVIAKVSGADALAVFVDFVRRAY